MRWMIRQNLRGILFAHVLGPARNLHRCEPGIETRVISDSTFNSNLRLISTRSRIFDSIVRENFSKILTCTFFIYVYIPMYVWIRLHPQICFFHMYNIGKTSFCKITLRFEHRCAIRFLYTRDADWNLCRMTLNSFFGQACAYSVQHACVSDVNDCMQQGSDKFFIMPW